MNRYAATIGFFDGVHLGHRYLIDQLKQQASAHGLQTMAVTFDRHPRQVLQSQWQPQLLTTAEEKTALLRPLVDHVEVLCFDHAMAALTAADFMQLLRDRFEVSLLLTGYDHRFGHNRSEGFSDYVRHGHELGMQVVAGQPLTLEGSHVSSSLLRRLLSDVGDVAEARRLLGRSYSLQGTVVGGEQVGRHLGYPTANLQPHSAEKLLPHGGAYAVMVSVDDSTEQLPGMMNIGRRPTFGEHGQTLEVHIFHFMGNLYGHRLTVSFVDRLRDELRFSSPDALISQLRTDALQAQTIINQQQDI